MLWAGRLDKIMATRKRHIPEQIVRKLMAADRLLAEGKDGAVVCRELGVYEAICHRWRNQFGGSKPADAKRLKDLGRENAPLKRLLADAELEKAAPGISRAQWNARRHISARSARVIFCESIHFTQTARTNANEPSMAISVASRGRPSATS
jgi:putative transposase